MRISLVPQDPTLTPLTLEGTISFPHGQRRLTRTKLVTGGSHILDRGQSIKDRIATVTLTLTSLTDEQTLEYWLTNRSVLSFSDPLGIYSCKIKSMSISQGIATLNLWVSGLIVSTKDFIYPPAYVSPGEWNIVTSDAFWIPQNWDPGATVFLLWNGVQWYGAGTTEFERWYSLEAGSWAVGLKPTKFKITYSYTDTADSVPTNFIIKTLPNYDTVYQSTFPVSGQEYDIDWENPYEGVAADHDYIYSILFEFVNFLFAGPISNSITITEIQFYSPAIPTPVPSWHDVTSDTYWEGYTDGSYYLLSWDGLAWSGTGTTETYADLNIIGSAANGYTFPFYAWSVGIRPTKFRITYTNTGVCDGFVINTYPDYNALYGSGVPVSGVEYDLDWSSPYQPGTHSALAEIRFQFSTASTLNITKIEFYY